MAPIDLVEKILAFSRFRPFIAAQVTGVSTISACAGYVVESIQ